jgi:hypothetical protein
MSLAEIKSAVKSLSQEELADLAAFIYEQDTLAWDREIDRDFSSGGKHHVMLADLDAAIDAGDSKPFP